MRGGAGSAPKVARTERGRIAADLVSPGAIPSVPNCKDHNGDCGVLNLIDDSVVPHSNAIGRTIREFSGGRWKRMGRE